MFDLSFDAMDLGRAAAFVYVGDTTNRTVGGLKLMIVRSSLLAAVTYYHSNPALFKTNNPNQSKCETQVIINFISRVAECASQSG